MTPVVSDYFFPFKPWRFFNFFCPDSCHPINDYNWTSCKITVNPLRPSREKNLKMAGNSDFDRAGSAEELWELEEQSDLSAVSSNADESDGEYFDEDALGALMEDLDIDIDSNHEKPVKVKVKEHMEPPVDPATWQLQRILGNWEPDERFATRLEPLPESLTEFIQSRLPVHAQEAATRYFETAIPVVVNEHLAKVLALISDRVIHEELAIFITEIINVVAIAKERTMLHPWGLFKQSDALVKWLDTLTSDDLKPVLGNPLSGRELASMLPSVRTMFGGDTAKSGWHHLGRNPRFLPSGLPTQTKHLINRLPVDCHKDWINLIVGLPDNIQQATAQIMQVAPPYVIKAIVDLVARIGHVKVEQLESIRINKPYMIFKLDAMLKTEDAILEWLSSMQDQLGIGIDGLKILRQLNMCQVLVSSRQLPLRPPATHMDVRSGPFTLTIGNYYTSILDHDVESYLGSLEKVRVDRLPETDRACDICKQRYEACTEVNEYTPYRVRLHCGHIFDASCLLEILTPKRNGGWGHDCCPRCRKRVEMNVRIVRPEGEA